MITSGLLNQLAVAGARRGAGNASQPRVDYGAKLKELETSSGSAQTIFPRNTTT